MKYLHRQPPKTAGRTAVEERIRGDMSDLMAKEQAVLEAWAAQRRRLDDCVKFVTVEVSLPPLPYHLLVFMSTNIRQQKPYTGRPLSCCLPSLLRAMWKSYAEYTGHIGTRC